MSWDRTGQTVRGKYIGQYEVTGKVIKSRVALGDRIKHTIQLSAPVRIGDLGFAYDTLVVEEKNIIQRVVDSNA